MGYTDQVLLGVTGSGKTFTIANVIEQINKPTLVISHNKTLAAQLYSELSDLFPENAVCYFVSFYDYYQPEAYIPQTDTYIEKDCDINKEIDRLRLEATSALMSRSEIVAKYLYLLKSKAIFNLLSSSLIRGSDKLPKDPKIISLLMVANLSSLITEFVFNPVCLKSGDSLLIRRSVSTNSITTEEMKAIMTSSPLRVELEITTAGRILWPDKGKRGEKNSSFLHLYRSLRSSKV